MPEATEQEKSLIKVVAADPEVQIQMIGNVKIHTPGLHNQKNKQKKKQQSRS
jgi:hypothetical protein